jgi:SpoVK/Ycf46/Vps4 family AAA+-type ATPase
VVTSVTPVTPVTSITPVAPVIRVQSSGKTLPIHPPPPPILSSSDDDDDVDIELNESDDDDDSDEDENGNLEGFVVDDDDDDEDDDNDNKDNKDDDKILEDIFKNIPKFNSDNELDAFIIKTTLSHYIDKLGPKDPSNDNCCNEEEDQGETSLSKRNNKKRPSGKLPPPLSIKKTKVNIEESIKSIDDLIDIADKYQDHPELEYPINIKYLNALKAPLLELKRMVGLNTIKTQILDQIMYLLSHKSDETQMLHTAIYGSAGSGKTTIANILAKIYGALGYSNGKFRAVKASELIAGYVGQTAIKTQKVIDEARGGVLFIDEAYSLASGKNDSDGFSKEAIDCLNQNLTERKTEFICIIAGYKQQLEDCFFSFNPGLNRRFPFRYHIESYTTEELYSIFHTQIAQSGWTIDPVPVELFKKHEPYLTQKGGDMENLAQLAKLAFSRRTFGKHQDPAKHLTLSDIQEAFKLFISSDEVSKRPDNIDTDSFFKKNIQPTLYI